MNQRLTIASAIVLLLAFGGQATAGPPLNAARDATRRVAEACASAAALGEEAAVRERSEREHVIPSCLRVRGAVEPQDPSSTITLNGAPLPTTVDVYRLIETVGQEEDEEEERPGWQKGLGVGALAGCAVGLLVLNMLIEDPAEGAGANLLACAIAGAYGAGVGAAVGVILR